MTVEQAMQAKWSATAGVQAVLGNPARIWLDYAQEGETMPYCVIQRIDAPRSRNFDGTSGLVPARLQVDVYGETKATVAAAAEALRVAVEDFGGTVTSGAESVVIQLVTLDNDNTEFLESVEGRQAGIRRASADYTVWHEETIP